MKIQNTEWFADWFDTSYYHILYKNRDQTEAESFIRRLVNSLQLEEGSHVLDLACGKGRHSITLSKMGFDVLGVDLSPNSIREAQKFEADNLSFEVHDMRKIIENEKFGAIFNLFTSFGYFDSLRDNEKVIDSISSMLLPKGLLVIDFMNAVRIINGLVAEEEKSVENILFKIRRNYDGTHIFKHIDFTDKGENFSYTERVQALKLSDFTQLLESAGFEILRTFGNFDLEEFEPLTSDRLIIVAQLKA